MNIINFGKVVSDRVLALIETNKVLVKQHRELVANGMINHAQQISKLNDRVITQARRYEPILDHLLTIRAKEQS